VASTTTKAWIPTTIQGGQRYKAAPVKTGLKAIKVPEFEKCSKCDASMKVRHRINNQFDIMIRILWECLSCNHTERRWKRRLLINAAELRQTFY
jgi:ribosomal protein L32